MYPERLSMPIGEAMFTQRSIRHFRPDPISMEDTRVVFAFGEPPGWANSVIPAVQNLMLAARALGIGSIPTTLHPRVMDRFRALFDILREMTFHFCIPLGYPEHGFGPNVRRPTSEATYLDRWGAPVLWK